MKHFMLPRNTILREQMKNPSSPNSIPSKPKHKHKKCPKKMHPLQIPTPYLPRRNLNRQAQKSVATSPALLQPSQGNQTLYEYPPRKRRLRNFQFRCQGISFFSIYFIY